MSFFASKPLPVRDRKHDNSAPGFGPAPDPFAGFSRRNLDADDGETYDFEDTYDGLGDQLEEDRDTFNDDTFGVGNIGTDFDFSGQGPQSTGQPTQDLGPTHPLQQPQPPPQEHFLSGLGQPSAYAPQQKSKPIRTGYERYGKSGIPSLEANAGIWGTQPQASASALAAATSQAPSIATATKKMMSLDEVEASLRANKKPSPAPPGLSINELQSKPVNLPPPNQPPSQDFANGSIGESRSLQSFEPQRSTEVPSLPLEGDVLESQPSRPQNIASLGPQGQGAVHGREHRQRPSQDQHKFPSGVAGPTHSRGPSLGGQIVTHPSQLLQLPAEERAALLAEDARRAKRNHKIHLLSKDNGLMTPQDKNFITRIQLQQLVAATGGTDDKETALTEDFYYVVLSQIRGAASNQPSNHFAQTYLNQLAWRGKRAPRAGESQMRRMEQQVQRAVEAAKARPANRKLVVEGSLGRISFSNSRTPRPLLNMKRNDSYDTSSQRSAKSKITATSAGKKTVLKDIENVYSLLMQMEDHERRVPSPTNEESSADEIQGHMDWRARLQALNKQLWENLKVLEPISPDSSTPHPFIAILSYPKGKKLVPRVFRQIEDQQRLTVLTIISIHLDHLDVVRLAAARPRDVPARKALREDVDLFTQAVMPSLFTYVSDAPMGIIVGLVGLITERVNLQTVVRSRVGLGFLTTFISRAELIKQGDHANAQDVEQWSALYHRLFDIIEPQLPFIFPDELKSGEDVYVWQFLAALGIGATSEQQQRLVIGVKDKVMGTVSEANAMPDELGRPQLDNVNLFLKAIGLDVEFLSS